MLSEEALRGTAYFKQHIYLSVTERWRIPHADELGSPSVASTRFANALA